METSQGSGGLFPSSPRNYVLSGKIMLSTIIVLFAIVFFILCIHVYARWFLLRRLRRRRERRRFVFAAEVHDGAARSGLDREILKSLPVYAYKSEESDSAECAVCLSEFQEKEKFREMPICKHRFHVECIDMWFGSHSTCPLCRAAVEIPAEAPVSVLVHVEEESGPSSSSSPGSSSSSDDVAGAEEGLKSPIGRMRSLKRMLSIDLRCYRGSSVDPDLESGAVEDRAPRSSSSVSLSRCSSR